jgi:hypothetical protein
LTGTSIHRDRAETPCREELTMHEKSVVLLNQAVGDELSAVHQYMYWHLYGDSEAV